MTPDRLQKCLTSDCRRKVPVGTRHCCAPCAAAYEYRHEIDQHSDGCNERSAGRGECDEYEALLLRQRGTTW